MPEQFQYPESDKWGSTKLTNDHNQLDCPSCGKSFKVAGDVLKLPITKGTAEWNKLQGQLKEAEGAYKDKPAAPVLQMTPKEK